MDKLTRQNIDNIYLTDANVRYEAYRNVIEKTKEPVDWAYEVWDDLIGLLKSGDNHQRSIAVQVLANLAKSDPESRMVRDLDKLMIVTKDEKFVTARHALQVTWKIAVASPILLAMVTGRLSERFKTCLNEKNGTLTRYDIIEVFRKIYDFIQDENVKNMALELIEIETDSKYKKKYQALWKDLPRVTK